MASAEDDESLSLLMSMGFDSTQVQQALQIGGGNVERAVECLLGDNNRSTSVVIGNTSRTSSGNVTTISKYADDYSQLPLVESEISQYSNVLGTSACTAIALTLVHNCLSQLICNKDAETVIDSTLLTTSVIEGIQLYNELKSNNNGDGAEHASVEELMAACLSSGKSIISTLKLFPNSPRQGILSSSTSYNKHMGIEALLAQCQIDATTSADATEPYIAVVITKPPETVLVILPNNIASSTNTNSKFILIDSHPRPQQLAPHFPTGSYALFHPTLSSLVTSLQEIFLVTELGDGVPELMQMMYNSFDIYPFHQSREEE